MMMSYEEVMEFALEHYNEGGDGTYECMSREDYEQEIAEGMVFTKKRLLQRFHNFNSVMQEYEAMANW